MTIPLGPDLPPVGGWRIISQTQQTRTVPGNAYPVTGYTVNFLTGYGVNGAVFIPGTQYTPDFVRQAVAAQVAQLDAVSALTHDSA